MATAKKKPRKKPTSKKPVKKSSTSVAARPASVTHRSFQRSANSAEFMRARFTEQTVYWLIIGAAVIGLAIWVLSIQVRLNDMYDAIDTQTSEVVVPTKKSTP